MTAELTPETRPAILFTFERAICFAIFLQPNPAAIMDAFTSAAVSRVESDRDADVRVREARVDTERDERS